MQILVGVDDSEPGITALDEVLSRATEAGDEVTVAVYGDPDGRERLASEVSERLRGAGLPVRVRDLAGDPGAQLVEIADGEGFDRVVVAGGGRTPMGKIRLGSVAEFVLLNAETTVTVVR